MNYPAHSYYTYVHLILFVHDKRLNYRNYPMTRMQYSIVIEDQNRHDFTWTLLHVAITFTVVCIEESAV